MARISKSLEENAFLAAALEGLELQKARIEAQIAQVRSMLGGKKSKAPEAAVAVEVAAAPAKRRKLSAAARKRIGIAQKRRWAKFRELHPDGK
jgi:hypothetical protein